MSAAAVLHPSPFGRRDKACDARGVRSLRVRLATIWLLSLAAAGAVGLLLVQLYDLSSTAQTARAETTLARACERIADRYAYYATGWTPPAQVARDAEFQRDMASVVAVALAGNPGVAGGVWQVEAGFFPDAAPAGGPPASERAALRELAEAAVQDRQPQAASRGDGSHTVLDRACPLSGPVGGLAAWVTTEVAEAAGLGKLRLGLGVLLALVLALSGWLTWLVLVWTRHVGRIEAALAASGADDLPRLAPTGEAELDRIVAALNTAGMRLAEARRRGAELSARVAAAERLAALGRVAAGVAHEIRNPVAAMRLKAENALAVPDPARREAALGAILAQIMRLDRLIAELLAMTQRRDPAPEPVDIPALLRIVAADHERGEMAVAVEAPPLTGRLDPALLRRCLDSLLDNAVRATPPGGGVRLRVAVAGDWLRVEVADDGPGVPPEVRASLFEPFVTTRADGTGLGLAIARELAEAQGGRIVLADAGGGGRGAVFALEVPWRPS